MALKGLVGKISDKLSDTFSGQGRGPWQPEAGPYPRLMLLEEDALQSLKDVGGLYALWHRGVRPQWIYAGHADDLGEALTTAQEHPDVRLYDLNEGVFVTWAVWPADQRAGAVIYLRGVMEPAAGLDALDVLGLVAEDAKPVTVPLPVD